MKNFLCILSLLLCFGCTDPLSDAGVKDFLEENLHPMIDFYPIRVGAFSIEKKEKCESVVAGYPTAWRRQYVRSKLGGHIQQPCMDCVIGCSDCYQRFCDAGLIKMKILEEGGPFVTVEVSLTSKGEQYDLINYIDAEKNPDLIKTLEAEKSHMRYVVFGVEELKDVKLKWRDKYKVEAKYRTGIAFTPFGKALDFEPDTARYARGYHVFQYDKDSGWRFYWGID